MIKELTTKSDMPLVLALGYFDSVHLGHRKLFETAVTCANELGANPAAATFTNNLNRYFKRELRSVYPYAERLELMATCGLSYVLPFKFTRKLMAKSPESFFNELCGRADIAAFVVGEDYTFGANAAGNADTLAEYARTRDIQTLIVGDVILNGQKVSGSMIRRFLNAGEIEKANEMLAAPYFMTGEVVKGRGEGHLFGFPTANLSILPEKLIPKAGVYGGVAEADGISYKTVVNIGVKPTFKDFTPTIEALLIDFSGNLYGKRLKITLHKRLRDIATFDSAEALGEQIRKDAAFEL